MLKYLSKANIQDLKKLTCLLRIDLNTKPGAKDGSFRLQASIPTIRFLLENGVKILILSHRGRPKSANSQTISNFPKWASLKACRPGISPSAYSLTAQPLKDFSQFPISKEFLLKPFCKIFQKILKQKVVYFAHFNFPEIKKYIERTEQKLFLLENLRFFEEEDKDSSEFAKQLAGLGDFYVNDAFAVSHRENASVRAITKFLPSYAGLLLEKEIQNLDFVMTQYKPPLCVILGGIKAEDKIGVIDYFKDKADTILLGGGTANTFLSAKGMNVYDSLRSDIKYAKPYLELKNIVLPEDFIFYKAQIFDIGKKTREKYAGIIKKANTIIWNGPMGFFEKKKFANGTKTIWTAIYELSENNKDAKIIIGGGETTTFCYADRAKEVFRVCPRKVCVSQRLFMSTGGGAMLEYLSGKKLPGIEALKND